MKIPAPVSQMSFEVKIAVMPLFGTGSKTWARAPETTFNLAVNPPFEACLGDSSGHPPTATVTVQRGNLNDVLILHAHHVKPNLAFDLFTTQNSTLLANGQLDLNFKNFGLPVHSITSTVTGLRSGEDFGLVRALATPTNVVQFSASLMASNQHLSCRILVQQPSGCSGLRACTQQRSSSRIVAASHPFLALQEE